MFGPIRQFILHNFGTFRKLSQWGINAGIYIAISGLFLSSWTLSMGLIVMGSASLIYTLTGTATAAKQRYSTHRIMLVAALLSVSVLTSWIGSIETDFAWTRTRIYAAFLLIPLIGIFAPPLPRKYFTNYLLFFLTTSTLSGLLTIIPLLNDLTNTYLILKTGGSLPSPVPHIRFGMFLSFSFLTGLYILLHKSFRGASLRYIAICTMMLLVIILALAIRTSWVLTVIGSVAILLHHAIQTRSFRHLIAGTAGILLIGVAAFFLLPSVRVKVEYTLWDRQQYEQGLGQNYSDSERMYSLINAWDLWKKQPLLGVGSGDLYTALKENAVLLSLPSANIPHNQIMFTLLTGGIISLMTFLPGYGFLLFAKHYRRQFHILLLYLLYSLTMMVEPTFETSMGVLSFVLIVTLLVRFDASLQTQSDN